MTMKTMKSLTHSALWPSAFRFFQEQIALSTLASLNRVTYFATIKFAKSLANPLSAPALRLYLFSGRLQAKAMARRDNAWFDFWRLRSDFPIAGWSVRSGIDSLYKLAPPTHFDMLTVNLCLISPLTPWRDPTQTAELKTLLSAKARQALDLGHALGLLAASWTIDRIPPSRPDLDRQFRQELSSINPSWHRPPTLDPQTSDDPLWKFMLMNDHDLKDQLDRVSQSQEALIERIALEQTEFDPQQCVDSQPIEGAPQPAPVRSRKARL